VVDEFVNQAVSSETCPSDGSDTHYGMRIFHLNILQAVAPIYGRMKYLLSI